MTHPTNPYSQPPRFIARRVVPVAEVRHIANQYGQFTEPSNRETLILDLAHTAELKYAQLERVRGFKDILEQLAERPGDAAVMKAEELILLVIAHLENILGETNE